MTSIVQNYERIGRFTSSEIHNLMSNGRAAGTLGKPALTYIEEKQMEKELLRSLKNEATSRELSWGKYLENRVFDLLGLEYSLMSQETKTHDTIENWSGSADGLKFDEKRTVVDIKCPFTLKSYCNMVKWDTAELLKENKPEYYWQLVSNAILNNCAFAELIVYVPYEHELNSIRLNVDFYENPKSVNWIKFAEDYELPYLKIESKFKNIHITRFEVPAEDKEALTERVKMANQLFAA